MATKLPVKIYDTFGFTGRSRTKLPFKYAMFARSACFKEINYRMRLVRILLIFVAIGSPCHAGEMEWSIGTINGVDWAHYRHAHAELIIQITPKSCGEWDILVSSETPPLSMNRTIELHTDAREIIVWQDFDGLRRATVTQTFVENLVSGRTLYVTDQNIGKTVKVPLAGFGGTYRVLNLDC